jgi:hypothetical protein
MASTSLRAQAHLATAMLAEAEPAVATPPVAPTPDAAQQRNQRRAVKAMAREFENDFREFKTLLHEHVELELVERFAQRCEDRQTALDRLRSLPLHQSSPVPTRLRSARSAALLAGAAMARANAAVVGGIGYATQGAARVAALALEAVVTTPVRGIENMLETSTNYRLARMLRDPELPSRHSVRIAGLCGAVVGIRGFATPALQVPAELAKIVRHSTSRGSLGYSLFTVYDQFPRVRTHVDYKNMGTAAIAEHATERIRIGLADAARTYGFHSDSHYRRQVLVGPLP